jgi:hypothetical protein
MVLICAEGKSLTIRCASLVSAIFSQSNIASGLNFLAVSINIIILTKVGGKKMRKIKTGHKSQVISAQVIRIQGASYKFLCTCALVLLITSGCGQIRFAPSEEQKQNAWVHNRTAAIAAQTAKEEYASGKLQALTDLSRTQSKAFVAYCGLPDELPETETAEDVLSESNRQLAATAIEQSQQRPDAWGVADSALELGIAVAGLFGGIYATRIAKFLQQAKAKSNALKEIVLANEIFKKTNPDSAEAFKDAQKNQSPLTRQLVVECKT